MLGCSVDTPIHINRSHLLCVASCVLCGLGLNKCARHHVISWGEWSAAEGRGVRGPWPCGGGGGSSTARTRLHEAVSAYNRARPKNYCAQKEFYTWHLTLFSELPRHESVSCTHQWKLHAHTFKLICYCGDRFIAVSLLSSFRSVPDDDGCKETRRVRRLHFVVNAQVVYILISSSTFNKTRKTTCRTFLCKQQ